MRNLSGLALAAAALALTAGCSSSANTPTASGTTPTPTTTTTPTTSAPTPTVTPTAAPTGAVDLHVTDPLRQALIAAYAAHQNLKPSDITGLRPGMTFYAYDNATRTYWAGAQMVPNPKSYLAQVSSQDEGAYILFHHTGTAPWQAIGTGGSGSNSGPNAGPCRVAPPADVLSLWGWPVGSCHPTGVF
jgi:hypothetical protein